MKLKAYENYLNVKHALQKAFSQVVQSSPHKDKKVNCELFVNHSVTSGQTDLSATMNLIKCVLFT